MSITIKWKEGWNERSVTIDLIKEEVVDSGDVTQAYSFWWNNQKYSVRKEYTHWTANDWHGGNYGVSGHCWSVYNSDGKIIVNGFPKQMSHGPVCRTRKEALIGLFVR